MNDLNIRQNKFRIRPDLVIHHQELTIVADTKWKIINQNLPTANYNISQSDMYQLLPTVKSISLIKVNTHLILIYPNHADFNNQLHFKFEEELRIDIVPFDFQNETTSLKIYLDLFQG